MAKAKKQAAAPKRAKTAEARTREPVVENRDPVPEVRDPARRRVTHIRPRCPVCGGTDFYFDGGTYRTANGRRVRYATCRSSNALGGMCGARLAVIDE